MICKNKNKVRNRKIRNIHTAMPTKKTPITTNVMSFKTFRSPDKIDHNDKNQFFIHHPDLSKSKFSNCPVSDENGSPSKNQVSKFLASFEAAKSYKEIREIAPSLYDYSSLLMQQKKNDSSKKKLTAKLPNLLKCEEVTRIWDELFYQIATKESNTVRQACIQLIITQHYATNNKTLDLKDVAKLTIVLPEDVINCFKPWYFEKCGGELFGVHNLGIQEYRRVEQTLCCYVPGEVSHIENIMAKEYKEKSTRNLLRTEYTTELTSETEIENLNDTTSTERNELSSEISKEQQKDKSFDISGSVTVSKDTKLFGAVTANASTGYSSNNSSSLANTEAKNYAKEVTERALERIVQKTSEKRTYKMIKEFEENNKHGFDNREGEQHVTGVYRWVDKIYDNELVNYGKRLLFEVDIPHPALFYKKAMEWKPKEKEDDGAVNENTSPKTLEEFKILSSADIKSANKETVNQAATYYGASIEWKVEEIIIAHSLTYDNLGYKDNEAFTPVSSVTIDPDYSAVKVEGSCDYNYKGRSGKHAYLNLFFGGRDVVFNGYCPGTNTKCHGNQEILLDLQPPVPSSLNIYLRHRKIGDLGFNVNIKCKIDANVLATWQEETYNQLVQSYGAMKAKYDNEQEMKEAALLAENDQEETENYSNPALNRLIEERELKRICIEMMSKPYCYDFGKSFNECKTYRCKSACGENEALVPNVIQNEELEKYAQFVKFFEKAFQWEIMTYVFHPYYYNEQCNWSELLQTKNDDPIFEAFLQSGMANLLVPVRPQYEKAVMHYMETGEIYLDGDLVPEAEDDRYLSLLSELGNQDDVTVEGQWKTRIPSTLTIIQANSSYLEDEQGLPCCDEDGSVFGSDENTLQSLKDE